MSSPSIDPGVKKPGPARGMSMPTQGAPDPDRPSALLDIAHDLNNILLLIQINAELVINEVPEDGRLVRPLNQILEATRRGKDMAQRIAGLLRGAPKDALAAEPGRGAYPRGTERILFVDDEDIQVRAMTKLLGHLGYAVKGMTDAQEALEVFRSQPDAFDLAIMDQTMPRLTGGELACELLKTRPGLPIILCSGYSETLDESRALAMGIRAFVLKPFSVREIAQSIRRVLGSA
jgi:CheY-like chemotaxis protein